VNALQFYADGFHMKKLCSKISQRKVHFLKKASFCVFSPLLGA